MKEVFLAMRVGLVSPFDSTQLILRLAATARRSIIPYNAIYLVRYGDGYLSTYLYTDISIELDLYLRVVPLDRYEAILIHVLLTESNQGCPNKTTTHGYVVQTRHLRQIVSLPRKTRPLIGRKLTSPPNLLEKGTAPWKRRTHQKRITHLVIGIRYTLVVATWLVGMKERIYGDRR
jgi:hypothetical protein|uniref:Uncharacterized protein n=1 Tax=Picea glauca TaxID=3330 RepID=A0A117NGC3_PICGL|nr:hypothetical protein ABT39_MTgene1667 [Picea glauca]QHR91882.1 hypothetical protein Q903MT_gene5918 [Picea sitchensis]